MDGTTPRPARLVGMDEVCNLLDVERRTVERWITDGRFPAPTRISDNKVAFPLADLLVWSRRKGDAFASEVERLAHTRAADLRPESLDKALAKRLTRQLGRTVQPGDLVIGAVPTADERAAAHQTWLADGRRTGTETLAAFGQLHMLEALLLLHCGCPNARPATSRMLLALTGAGFAMTESDCAAVVEHIVNRALAGECSPADTPPGDVLQALIAEGILRGEPAP